MRKLLELRRKLLLRQKLLLELVLQLVQMLELVLEQLRKLLERKLLLLFCRKRSKRLPTGKRARVIFSCLYFR